MTARLLRSLTFRLALIYLALFTLSVAALLAATWWAAVLEPLRDVRAAVGREAQALAALYDPVDPVELADRLAAREETPADRAAFHVLESPSGEVIAANITRWPRWTGEDWRRFELEEYEWEGDREHEVLARDLRLPDGSRLLVGRDTEDLDDREEMLADALGWGAGATLAAGLLGSLLMSLAVGRRIEAVAGAARRVMAGDLSGRVALRGAGDDFDRLGETLNEMLARIEALVQSVSRVSDSIAHELRTPLTRLHADLDELVQSLEDDDLAHRRLAEQALREAERLQTTFDALLRIARIETGRHARTREKVGIAELLEDAADLYGPAAEGRGQRIQVDADPGLAVSVDPDLLFQAVSNLLDNAIKHGAVGEVVDLSARGLPAELEIAVRDRGPGVTTADRRRLTERFYRAPGSEGTDGLGLGLSLVAAVAGLHGGRLSFEDAAPGLRVVLRLPA